MENKSKGSSDVLTKNVIISFFHFSSDADCLKLLGGGGGGSRRWVIWGSQSDTEVIITK